MRNDRERASRRCGLLLVLSGVVAAGLLPPDAQGDEADAVWQRQLDSILTDKNRPKTVVGASIIELPSGRVLFEKNADQPLMTASNMKLMVIAAAIDQLGADFEFTTVLAVRGKDLVVVGGGDPTFGDDRLAELRGETITRVLREWADKLIASGVRQIPGDIIIDDSIFDEQFTHPNWPADQYEAWYEAPVGGLNFNGNCFSLNASPGKPGERGNLKLVPGNTLIKVRNSTVSGGRNSVVANRKKDSDTVVVSRNISKDTIVGPITVRDPGIYFGYVFRTVLAAKGVRVGGSVVRSRVREADGKLPADCHLVAIHRSSLRDALSRAGKNSLGMVAEALIKTLGVRTNGTGSWDAGRSAVMRFLQKAGVPAGEVRVDEGSGLSRNNRLSARAATRVLAFMFKRGSDTFDVLRESLAVAGVDGTLDKRMRHPDTKGRIFAKTGYIKGVRTLAGFIHTRSDRWLAFAFFYNQANTAQVRQMQDQACRSLVHWPEAPSVPAAASSTPVKRPAASKRAGAIQKAR